MKSLLIIGGSGFFGKSFLDAFQRGILDDWMINEITIVARNATRLLESNPNLITNQIKLLNLDIKRAIDIPSADYVIHAATSTDARNYQLLPEVETENILQGTDNYCRLAEKYHRNSKILFTSSGAVYGQQPPSMKQIDEQYFANDLKSIGAQKLHYAHAKNKAEFAMQSLAKKGLDVSIARCFAFVGRYLPRDQHFAIGNFLGDALNGKPICVKANHPVYRSYMYADDLVEWLMTIADHAQSTCPIFNVGSNEETSLINLATIIANRFGLPTNIRPITSKEEDRYIPCIQKARDLLKLQIKYDLAQAINKTISLI